MTTSRDIKGRINDMRNNTISNTAQQIVLSTLNGVETEGRSVQQLIALFNSNKPTMNVALDDLEQANLAICCHGKGQNRREKQLVWLKSSRKLWTAALPFLQSPVSGIVYSATPAQSSFFTISGETLLHERVPEFTSKAKPATCTLKHRIAITRNASPSFRSRRQTAVLNSGVIPRFCQVKARLTTSRFTSHLIPPTIQKSATTGTN